MFAFDSWLCAFTMWMYNEWTWYKFNNVLIDYKSIDSSK